MLRGLKYWNVLMKLTDHRPGLIDLDPWLEPYADLVRRRFDDYQSVRSRIDEFAWRGVTSGDRYGPQGMRTVNR